MFYVHLAGPQHPDLWSNISLDVSVKVFLDEIKVVGFEKSRLLFFLWVGLVRSIEGPNRTKTDLFLSRKEFCRQMAFRFTCRVSTSLGPQPASSPCRLWLHQPSTTVWASSLKSVPLSISLSLSLSLSVLFLWRSPTNTEITWVFQTKPLRLNKE